MAQEQQAKLDRNTVLRAQFLKEAELRHRQLFDSFTSMTVARFPQAVNLIRDVDRCTWRLMELMIRQGWHSGFGQGMRYRQGQTR